MIDSKGQPMIVPRFGPAPSPGRLQRLRNDRRPMIHPRCTGTPRRGRRARPRNDQGPATPAFTWSCRPHWCSIFLRDPSRRPDHERSGWRAVPGRRRSRSQRGGCPGGTPPRFASTAPVCRWPGWDHYRPRGCAGGRTRRGGTPVHDETVTAGCPRNYPVVPNRSSRPTTSQLPRSLPDGLYAGPGGKPSFSQRAHTHRQFANRTPNQPQPAARPLAFPMGKHAPRRSDLPSPSPTDQREGRPKPRQPRQLARPGHSHTFRPVRTAPSSNSSGRKCRSYKDAPVLA
jgi:hypothetical protein